MPMKELPVRKRISRQQGTTVFCFLFLEHCSLLFINDFKDNLAAQTVILIDGCIVSLYLTIKSEDETR